MYKTFEFYDEKGVETYCILAEKKGYKIISVCALNNPEALKGNSVDDYIYKVFVRVNACDYESDISKERTQDHLISVCGSPMKRTYEGDY